MKKILKALIVVFLVIIFGILVKLFYPKINIKHTVKNYNLSFWCANYYEEISENEEVKTYKSNCDSITIEVYNFRKDFLSNIGIVEKVDDYKNLLSSVNYEAVLQNENTEFVQISSLTCGKYSTEIKSLKQIDKEITIIIPCEEYDLMFSIHGTKEDMDNKNKSIEKILKSVKLK